jgi:chromosome segregation ATPase
MAEEFASAVNETQCKLNNLFRSMMERLETERERADQLERQRDELLISQSHAQERETNLANKVNKREERVRELEQSVADERARAKESNDEHVRKHLKARKKVKTLETKIKRMKQVAAAAIPEQWAKAQLLREQKDTIAKSQVEIDELRVKLHSTGMEVSQRDLQVEELKRELEHTREKYREADMVSLQRLEELQDRFEAESQSLRHEASEEKRKRQAMEQQLERSKRRSELRNAKHQRETALLKLEICESQDMAAEMRQELHQRQSEIGIRSAALTANNDKISELSQSIEKLKDEHATAQQGMSAQLVAAQGDTATFRDKLEMATHELRDVRQELVTVKRAVATLSTRGGAAEVIRSIGNHLRQISQRSEKFCNPNHSQYRHVTNCGTLLCSECLQQSLPDGSADTAPTFGSKDVFEVNCPWCQSEFWTWETLTIPYSVSWITGLKAVVNTIDRFKPTLIAAENCVAVKEL